MAPLDVYTETSWPPPFSAVWISVPPSVFTLGNSKVTRPFVVPALRLALRLFGMARFTEAFVVRKRHAEDTVEPASASATTDPLPELI